MTSLAAPADLLVRNVRAWPREPGGQGVDVLVAAGRIAAAGPALEAPTGTPEADGRGGVLLPALAGLVENDRATWRSAEKPVAERATYTLGRTIASGATRVRSHAQVDTDSPARRWRAGRLHHRADRRAGSRRCPCRGA